MLMPTYNCERYIDSAINSILSQSFEDFEFLIIDDASEDETPFKILQYHDSRIRFIQKKENTGLVQSLNIGITMAKGKYIARMDGDDIALHERLEMQYRLLKDNKGIGVCGTWADCIDENGEMLKTLRHPIKHEDIKAGLLSYCTVVHPSVLIRKSIFSNRNHLYDARYSHVEDYELWVRLMKDNIIFENIPRVLLKYRFHSQQVSRLYYEFQKPSTNEVGLIHLYNLSGVLSNEERDIHTKFISNNVNGSRNELKRLRSWLLYLDKKNRGIGYFSVESLNHFIKSHLEANIVRLKYYHPYLLLLLFSHFHPFNSWFNPIKWKTLIKTCIFWKSR